VATTAAVNRDGSEVERIARAGGAALFGVAAVSGGVPAPFREYPRAVVAAVPLSRGVVATCVNEPTRIYAYHYRVVNATLDGIACRLASFLESRGYETLAVPASQVIDWERMAGAVSHARLARLAGLGFIGRHNLLVARGFGAAVRLVSVFTTAPLDADAPGAGGCGDCYDCREACPAGAIGASADGWDRARCLEKLREFKKRITNQYICGVCVRACPGRAAVLSECPPKSQ
jgi:epoxyqueuosine reductase QueG